MKLLLTSVVLLLLAQETHYFYDADGEYRGQAQTNGSETFVYGADGEYRGQVQTNPPPDTDKDDGEDEEDR